MTGRRRTGRQPSVLSAAAREILVRTGDARMAIEEFTLGVEVDGNPIALGPKRDITSLDAAAAYRSREEALRR